MDIYPFQISDPATGEYFIGRKSYLNKLKSLILSPQCPAVSVYGLARIGKSSIVCELERLIAEENKAGCFFITVTVSRCESYFKLWRSVLNSMKRIFKRNKLAAEDFLEELQELEPEDIDTALELVELGLEVAQDNDIQFVFVFEEFDAAKKLFEGKPSRFQHLRELKGAKNRLPIIFVSRESINNIEVVACGTSLLYLSLQPINIKPFDELDLVEFHTRLAGFGIELSQEAKDRLHYYAGAFPFFLTNIANVLVEQKINDKAIDVNNAFKECELLFHGVYASVLNHLQAEGLQEPFVQVFLGPQYDLREKELDDMRARGYIVTEENEQNKITSCATLSDWFVDYLHKDKSIGSNSAWLILSDAELILRRLIRYAYDQKYKDKGFFVMLLEVNENKWIPLKKIGFGTDEKGRSFLSFMNNNIKENHDADILKAAAIKDLMNILEYYWSVGFSFKQYFANEAFEVWKHKLSLLDRARIPFAHNNYEFLKSTDIQGIQVYANEIKEINERFKFPETGPVSPEAYVYEQGILKINCEGIASEPLNWRGAEGELLVKDTITIMSSINRFDKNGIYGIIKGQECFCHKKYLQENIAGYLGQELEVKVLSFNEQYGRYIVIPVEGQ